MVRKGTVGTGCGCLPGPGHGTVTVRHPLMCHIIVVASHRPASCWHGISVSFRWCTSMSRWLSVVGSDSDAAMMGGHCGWALWMVVVVVEEEEGCCLLMPMVHRIYWGHVIVFQWLLGAAVRVFSHSCAWCVMLLSVQFSYLTLFLTTNIMVFSIWNFSRIHMDLFHRIHMDLSMESKVDMPPFHMESMMSMEQQIGWGLSHNWFHGLHMDSIWNNLGKVKTSFNPVLIFQQLISIFKFCEQW